MKKALLALGAVALACQVYAADALGSPDCKPQTQMQA